MGGALGFTLDKPLHVGFAVFTALGLGMAAPYVVLAWFPRWLEKLPRPGPWMDTFKKVMAVPLLATAAWLVWVFGKLVGDTGVWVLLGGLALAAAGLVCFGRFGQRATSPRVRRGLGYGVAGLLVLGGAWLSLSRGPAPATAAVAPEGGLWVAFEPQRIEQLRAQGRPVFVDFTADWCLTCKFNEKTFIDVPEIHDMVAEHGFVMMKADWTRKDAVITEALARFRRGSVPLYVLYGPDPERRPIVLPEAITTSLLKEAMAHAVSLVSR
jgi:thiol:disulfide interchange protein DsbD